VNRNYYPKFIIFCFNPIKNSKKTNKEDKTLEEKAGLAYEQLCWFDPITALSIKGV